MDQHVREPTRYDGEDEADWIQQEDAPVARIRHHHLVDLCWTEARRLQAEGVLALSSALFGKWMPLLAIGPPEQALRCLRYLRCTCSALRDQLTDATRHLSCHLQQRGWILPIQEDGETEL